MAARLTWHGEYLLLDGMRQVGAVRTRCANIEYDFVTDVAGRYVSEPYQSETDAQQDCESEVRRLLKEAGIEVMP